MGTANGWTAEGLPTVGTMVRISDNVMSEARGKHRVITRIEEANYDAPHWKRGERLFYVNEHLDGLGMDGDKKEWMEIPYTIREICAIPHYNVTSEYYLDENFGSFTASGTASFVDRSADGREEEQVRQYSVTVPAGTLMYQNANGNYSPYRGTAHIPTQDDNTRAVNWQLSRNANDGPPNTTPQRDLPSRFSVVMGTTSPPPRRDFHQEYPGSPVWSDALRQAANEHRNRVETTFLMGLANNIENIPRGRSNEEAKAFALLQCGAITKGHVGAILQGIVTVAQVISTVCTLASTESGVAVSRRFLRSALESVVNFSPVCVPRIRIEDGRILPEHEMIYSHHIYHHMQERLQNTYEAHLHNEFGTRVDMPSLPRPLLARIYPELYEEPYGLTIMPGP